MLLGINFGKCCIVCRLSTIGDSGYYTLPVVRIKYTEDLAQYIQYHDDDDVRLDAKRKRKEKKRKADSK